MMLFKTIKLGEEFASFSHAGGHKIHKYTPDINLVRRGTAILPVNEWSAEHAGSEVTTYYLLDFNFNFKKNGLFFELDNGFLTPSIAEMEISKIYAILTDSCENPKIIGGENKYYLHPEWTKRYYCNILNMYIVSINSYLGEQAFKKGLYQNSYAFKYFIKDYSDLMALLP